MKAEKLAELGNEELKREAVSLEEQIFRLRFQLQTGNAENPAKIRETRRDLARVRTLLREREIGIERRRGAAKTAAAGKEGSR